MEIKYCIIILLCWIVFSIVILIGDKTHTILIDPDWLFIVLTAPVTIPAIILIFPVVLIIRITRKVKYTRSQKVFLKNKK